MQRQLNSDLLHLIRILECLYKLIRYSAEYKTAEEFFQANEQMPFNASLTLIAQVGEESNKLSAELKGKYTNVNWEKIYGLRNRIVHDYAGIDKFITFTIVKNETTQLIEQIIPIIETEIAKGTFDKKEFEYTAQSGYYKYIDFSRFKFQ